MPTHTPPSRARLLTLVVTPLAVMSTALPASVIWQVPSVSPPPATRQAPSIDPDVRLSATEVQRLRRRTELSLGLSLSEADAQRALASRQALLRQRLAVRIATGRRAAAVTWDLSPQQPGWVTSVTSADGLTFVLDERRVRADLQTRLDAEFPAPTFATVVDESTDAYGVRRVTVEGTATSGYVGDRGAILDTLVTQLRTGAKVATVDLSWQPATLLWNTPEGESLTLERLATGRSNFAKSPNGRSFNVQKALTERLNGAVAAPDESFSFNRVLKGASGWKEALGIFEGGELRPVQGGGICQAATTLYRAIALAGLPVDSRASHSLYVTYYSAHGVGLDATIFPGAQDLRFTNDTGAPVVMLARHEGDEAYVDLFGLNDGRSVVLTGPFFSENAPADVLVNNRAVRANEIVWQQAVTWPDGRQASNLIVSRYKSIPRSVPGQYPVGTLTNEEPPVAGGL